MFQKYFFVEKKVSVEKYFCGEKVSVEKARSQAKEYNHSFKRELSFLAIHGFLHLLGYDHMEKEDEEIMFKKQEEVLSRYEIVR